MSRQALNTAQINHTPDKPPRPAHPCRGLTRGRSPNSLDSCTLKLGWAPRWPLSAQGSASGRPCPSAPQHSDPTARHPLAALTKDLRQCKQHKSALHNIPVPDVLVSLCARVYKNTLKRSGKGLLSWLGRGPASLPSASPPPPQQ